MANHTKLAVLYEFALKWAQAHILKPPTGGFLIYINFEIWRRTMTFTTAHEVPKFETAREVPDLEAAMPIVGRAFPGIPEEFLEEDTRNHLTGTVYSHYNRERKLVGFSSYEVGKHTLYLAGIALDPDVQNNGLAYEAIGKATQDFRRDHLALVTQNPRMARALFKRGHEIDLGQLEPDVKTEISVLSGIPAQDAPIHFGRYPEFGLYGPDGAPKSNDQQLNERFESMPSNAGLLIVTRPLR